MAADDVYPTVDFSGIVIGSQLRLRPGDQPLPVPNERTDVQSQLIEHIRARRNLGVQRYGTALQPFNGRDAGQDLLDELLDGATYAMQLVIERRELEERNRALQEENHTLRQDRATLTAELQRVEDNHCGCI